MLLAAIRSSTVTLKRMAISQRVSPDWTIYTGPGLGVGVWAETGEEAMIAIKVKKQMMIRLFMNELEVIPNMKLVQSLWLNF
jgi:hypothetical protein